MREMLQREEPGGWGLGVGEVLPGQGEVPEWLFRELEWSSGAKWVVWAFMVDASVLSAVSAKDSFSCRNSNSWGPSGANRGITLIKGAGRWGF